MSNKVQTRVSMEGTVHKAMKVLTHLIDPKYFKSDQSIPMSVIKKAKGLAFVTVVKAGFVFSGSLGGGIVIARTDDGQWSGPSGVSVAGMGWGALIGASSTDSVIILNTKEAVKAFSGKGQIKFGGNLSIAAGPVGRDGDASVSGGDGGVAACYSYSHSRGLFAGLSLQGVIMAARDSENKRFYGDKVSPRDILAGRVQPPPLEDLSRLYELLRVVDNTPSSSLRSRSHRGGSDTQSFKDSDAGTFHAHHEDFAPTAPGAGPGAGSANVSAADFSQFGSATGHAQGQGSVPTATAMTASPDFAPSSSSSSSSSSRTTNSNYNSKALPPGWTEVYAADGTPYYWNERTDETQWERPVALTQTVPPPLPPR